MPRENSKLTLRPETFHQSIPISTTWLLADCMELRGKEDLWTRQKPEVLRTLRQQAIVQSVESSNRIEGVTVQPGRLRPLVLGGAKARERSEEELVGYRTALNWIFRRKNSISLDPKIILALHKLAQGVASSDAGKFKIKDNEIVELKPNVGRVVRFRPTPANETPLAIRSMCDAYGQLLETSAAPPLLIIATCIFDFLCIHPFRDGNGRISRLLTTLLLQSQNFGIGRLVSLERLIEESKEEYYRVLGECSKDWAAGKNLIFRWWNYFLSIVRRGYVELAEQVKQVSAHGAKTQMVRAVVLSQTTSFQLSEVVAQVPAASGALVRRTLQLMRDEGLLGVEGHGRAAVWRLKHPGA